MSFTKLKKRILFVCLGNICRSPAAEGVFLSLIKRKRLEDRFFVDSAGTGAWHVGNDADERMLSAAKKRGIILQSKARQVKIEDLYDFDLILTMDNENLDAMNLLAKDKISNIKAEIKPILSYSKISNSLEVPDPYYGGANGFENVLDLLEDSCEALLEELSLME